MSNTKVKKAEKKLTAFTDLLSREDLTNLVASTQDKISAIKQTAQIEFHDMEESRAFLEEARKAYEEKEKLYNNKIAGAVEHQRTLEKLIFLRDGKGAKVFTGLNNNEVKRKHSEGVKIKWRDEAAKVLEHECKFLAPAQIFDLITKKFPGAEINVNAKYYVPGDLANCARKVGGKITADKDGLLGLADWLNEKGELTQDFLKGKFSKS